MTLLMPVFMASTILVPAFLGDMKSGGTRRIVLVANNPEIAEAVKQQLMAPQAAERQPGCDRKEPTRASRAEKPRPRAMPSTSTPTPRRPSATSLRQQITDGKIDGFLWLADSRPRQPQSGLQRQGCDRLWRKHRIAQRGAVRAGQAPVGAKGHERRGGRNPAQAHRLRLHPHREGQGRRQRHLGVPGLVHHGDAALRERAGVRIRGDALHHRREKLAHSGSSAVVGDREATACRKDHRRWRGRLDADHHLAGGCGLAFSRARACWRRAP